MTCYEDYTEVDEEDDTDGAMAMRNLCPTCEDPMLLSSDATLPVLGNSGGS